MAVIVYGNEGDSVIVTRIDLGHGGDEYLVEVLDGYGGYSTVYSTFNYDKAIAKAKSCDPKF